MQLVELGEQAAYDTGIHGLHAELIKLIGRMRYRTSYGQNIYEHSKEVAWLAGMMAAELHLDVQLAKRGGLLHDVGKVLTHDNEGTHVELGVEVARRYGESAAVINCIQAHHDDVPHESAESVLVQAADAISGSRPGARREAFETYVKRLTRLEEIANGFPGVEKCNVIQAGREVRVVVTPDRIDDSAATPALGDDRPQDRERAAVSGADQGGRDQGDESRGLRSMSAKIHGRGGAGQDDPRRSGGGRWRSWRETGGSRVSRPCWSARTPRARCTCAPRARRPRKRACTPRPFASRRRSRRPTCWRSWTGSMPTQRSMASWCSFRCRSTSTARRCCGGSTRPRTWTAFIP